MKNYKTFYGTKTASHLQEITQPSPNPPPSDKMLLRLWKKICYGDIQKYTEYLLSKYLQFLGVTKWCCANVFSDTEQKHVCWKIFTVRKVFGCITRAYYFQCQVSRGP